MLAGVAIDPALPLELTREPPVLYFARINPGSAGRRGLCKGCVSSAMIDASLPSRLGEGSAPSKLPDPA
jgi:hypothetical protein